jgi:hypothetical protein
VYVHRFGDPTRRLLRAALCASTLTLSAAPALPQGGGSRERAIRERNADMIRELEIRRREGSVKTTTPQPSHPALPYARGKEDFRTLQLVNNDLMRAVFAAGAAATPDYERIALAAAEINKRASRLKSNLKLPEPEQASSARPQASEISNDDQLRASLRALDRLIMGFVTNPVFRDPGTVDGRHSVTAAENLTRITELSRAVRLSAERMRKTRRAAG